MDKHTELTDRFGRKVSYLRLSVTDRCDFRCTYCMAEDMRFLPRKELLSFEELLLVAEAFCSLGVEKIRITGGEPLIRRDIVPLLARMRQLPGLRELSMTTNASHLADCAAELKAGGLDRINISLDSLNPERFKTLTRHGDLATVLKGIDAARKQGFKRLKINSVALKNFNFDESCELAMFALERDMDISFIEEMPLGEITSHARDVEFVSSAELREQLSKQFELSPVDERTGGPSRYWQVNGYRARIGFISPHSENFCASCNRVRLTASGRLLLCLGNEHSVDLRDVVRSCEPGQQLQALQQAIRTSMQNKPEKHHFDLNEAPQVLRFMNATGG
ncbi:GTP 3',8-cyclase MoaA [Agaribacterium haliotis]|uniref:GTP 3',8-cyclase MoaA n=1 Tax=Agaribacterium haliotis TaxID=2013869 RepID=UPI000BB5660B|nr:GTP 3',8-cyclase MoaA [Agaribacterium haliotis]